MTDDRFISPEQPPEGLERELLTILAEEAAEVIHRISKALRFSLNDKEPGNSLSNLQRIEYELGDMQAVIQRLIAIGLLNPTAIVQYSMNKHTKLDRYLQNDR